MGNRSYLYITRPKDSSAGYEEIADANNNLPILWQILLAQGQADQAIEFQRVFGNAKTPNVAADANAALARFKQFADYLRKHPQYRSLKWLGLYLDATEQHLAALITRWTEENKKGPIFSANLDELSWLEEGSTKAFIGKILDECDSLWQALEEAMTCNDYDLIDEHLDFKKYGQKFEDWDAWTFGFGFCNFQHPYFQGFYESKPRTIPYSKYDPSDDDIGLLEYFNENGKWGIKSPTGKVVLAPTYDELYEFEKDSELALVKLGDQYGYINRNGNVAIPLQFDDAYDFFSHYEKDKQRAIAVKNGLNGLINRKGNWVVAPTYSDMRSVDDYGEEIAVKINDSWGVIDSNGKEILSPRFPYAPEKHSHFPFYFYSADENSHKHYLNRQWQPILIDESWELDQSYDEQNYTIRLTQGSEILHGLVSETGSVLLEPIYTEIGYQYEEKVYKTKLDKKYGLYRPDVGWLLECKYDKLLQPKDSFGISIDHKECLELYIVKHAKKFGVYSTEKQRWLIPCETDKVMPFRKDVVGVFYNAKHEKSGWWVHKTNDGSLLSGSFKHLVILHGSTFDFACGLAFTDDNAMALTAKGAQPLTQKQADLLCEKLPNDSSYHFFGDFLNDVEWQLIYASASPSAKSKAIVTQADLLYGDNEITEALPLYHQAAEQGNGDAMVSLSYIYGYKDAFLDENKEREWSQRAMDAGSAMGKNNYALCLLHGRGGEKNIPLAISLFQEAIEAGNLRSASNLADIYYHEDWGLQDFDAALNYYLLAYSQHPCPLEIGYIYDAHLGDFKNAANYYQQAGQAGEGYALNRLGAFWEDDVFGKPDLNKAINFYRKALKVKYSEPWAGLNLARLLVNDNPKEARLNWQIAMDAGIEAALDFGKAQGWC